MESINQHLKILFLEDSRDDYELVMRELTKAGISNTAKLTDNQKEFEELVTAFNPDIILSDYSLPGFDAVTAFHIARKLNCCVPFILVSGTIGEENAVEMIKVGITDYVLKDRLYSLVPKIKRALREYDDLRKRATAEENLKEQRARLMEIAFLQSHQMRVPVAQILGLFALFDFDNVENPGNVTVMKNLKTVAETLDKLIHQIAEKIEQAKSFND